MPRALMFSPAFAPHLFSEGLVNSKLALAMKRNGWDLDVIAMPLENGPSYEAGWNDLWRPLKECRIDVETVEGKPKSARRLACLVAAVLSTRHCISGVYWARKACQEALIRHAGQPYDLVLSRSTSCCAHLPAMLFKKAVGTTWVANWNDPPPYLFPSPYRYRMHPLQRLMFRRYLRAAARAADINSFPSRRLYDHIKAELALHDESRVKILPHIGLDGFAATPWRKKNGLVFCHAGNLSAERHPETFLDAFRNIIARHSDIQITCEIIGKENAGLASHINGRHLGLNVRFLGAKPFEETLAEISRCDVAVLIEAPCENGVFLPSKIIDYAQAGRPVLSVSPATGVMHDLLKEHGGGLHADNLSAASVEAAMEQFVALWRENRLNDINTQKLASIAAPAISLDFFKSLKIGCS